VHAWRLLLLLLLLCNAIEIEVLVVGGGVEAMALRRGGRCPWVGELGRAGIWHVVEVHAAEALLIVDGHCHLCKDDQ